MRVNFILRKVSAMVSIIITNWSADIPVRHRSSEARKGVALLICKVKGKLRRLRIYRKASNAADRDVRAPSERLQRKGFLSRLKIG
jgi:hypothetical protein